RSSAVVRLTVRLTSQLAGAQSKRECRPGAAAVRGPFPDPARAAAARPATRPLPRAATQSLSNWLSAADIQSGKAAARPAVRPAQRRRNCTPVAQATGVARLALPARPSQPGEFGGADKPPAMRSRPSPRFDTGCAARVLYDGSTAGPGGPGNSAPAQPVALPSDCCGNTALLHLLPPTPSRGRHPGCGWSQVRRAQQSWLETSGPG
nr:hypothetical protein [Tanacetum cinerariifolium]